MPRRSRFASSLCSALLFVVSIVHTPQLTTEAWSADSADEEGFKPAFNGKNLAGWVAVNTAPSTWKIQDGMLICSGKPIGELRTDRMYQNFVMELEWRHMVPRGNIT